MTPAEARAILADRSLARQHSPNRVLKGMTLLAEKGEDTNIALAAEHDIIFFGDFERTVTNMTEQEVRQMSEWGWFERDESWAHHV